MARSFIKRGLRRDLNFTDIVNPVESLNNLLNNLVQVEGEVFEAEDLKPIQNISSAGINNSDIFNIIGAATRIVNSEGLVEIYNDPLIKIKNRIDGIQYTSGVPQLFGGNGLTADYYSASNIDSEAASQANIFAGEPADSEIFWEQGNFDFLSFEPLSSIFGGIEFNGFFKPTETGSWSMPTSTTGFITFEFNGELLVRKSQIEYDFPVDSVSSGSVLTLQTIDNIKNILVGDRVINTSIAQFNDPSDPVFVSSINRSTGEITLSQSLEASITSGEVFTFEFQFGLDGGSVTVPLGDLEAYEAYSIRIRYWIPEESFVSSNMDRLLNVNVAGPNVANTNLNYRYLYSSDYLINPTPGSIEYGQFRNFFENRLNYGGGTVGGDSVYSDYQSVETIRRLNIKYTPPTNYADIQLTTKTVSYNSSTDRLAVPVTDGIEIGNYVIGAGIATVTRVSEVSLNSTVILDTATITSETDDSVTFIDHRGLKALDVGASWTSGNSTITGLSADTISKIRVGDMVLLNGSQTYTTVVTVGASSVTVSKTFTASSSANVDGIAFFYSSTGLINDSLITYCQNVYSAETTVQSNTGSNTLTVNTDAGLTTGQVVQFGSRIPAGTTVVSITPSGGDFDIVISNNITDTIPSDQLITFTPSGTTDSKEICFPPADTSPPFTATLLGLETTDTRPSVTINPVSGISELKFVRLSADNITTETASESDTYNRTISIVDGTGITYKILGSTT